MGKQVTIGGEEAILEEFSGYKAFAAMEQLKVIFTAGPQIDTAVAAYVRAYESENAVVLDRATALHRFGGELAHLTDADWEATGNQLKVPQSPGAVQIGLAAMPVAIEIAKKETIELLALLALTNAELEEADMAGGDEAVAKLVTDSAKRLLHRAKAHELLALAGTSAELLEEQFEGTVAEIQQSETLGKLLRLLGMGEEEETELEQQPSQTLEHAEPEQPASDPTPSSSTSSPEPMGGPSEPPSTEPAGAASPSFGG